MGSGSALDDTKKYPPIAKALKLIGHVSRILLYILGCTFFLF
jgi:hypothetical protein